MAWTHHTVNYALSRIGMANTIFLADLYFDCINPRYHVFKRIMLPSPHDSTKNSGAPPGR
jgi:hypothetical protein